MISAPASRARATTGWGAGWLCGMPGDSTSEGMTARSALRRSTMVTPASAAASRFLRSSSHAITSAPPRAKAWAATKPDLPRPRTPTGMPLKEETSIIAASPQLQRRQPGERQDRGDDPETDDDGLLLPALLLEMVVQRRHAENAATSQLEASHLHDHRDGFEHEETADEGEDQLVLGDDADGAERAADRERTGIAHEDHRRRRVEPQEAEPGTDHGHAEDGERSGHRPVME